MSVQAFPIVEIIISVAPPTNKKCGADSARSSLVDIGVLIKQPRQQSVSLLVVTSKDGDELLHHLLDGSLVVDRILCTVSAILTILHPPPHHYISDYA